MAVGGEATDLVAPVAKLAIATEKPEQDDLSVKPAAAKPKDAKKKKTKKKQVIADSWDDEEVSSEDDEPPAPPLPRKTQAASTASPASPPPPSASTPSYPGSSSPALSADWSQASPSAAESAPARRPEKTDAVARRLIASALGIRVPQTAEQRAYNKSLLEAERKKREAARAEKKLREEEAEKARKAVWEE